jgi:hypothetical protein
MMAHSVMHAGRLLYIDWSYLRFEMVDMSGFTAGPSFVPLGYLWDKAAVRRMLHQAASTMHLPVLYQWTKVRLFACASCGDVQQHY